MKICIVTPKVVKGDGQGRANYEIVWEAIRRNHHVTLLTKELSPELEHHPSIEWIRFALPKLPTGLLEGISFALYSSNWLKKYRSNFDLVQVYGGVTFAPGDVNTAQFVHSSWLRSPVHISRQNRNLYGAYHWLYTKLNAYWEKTAFQQAKVAIAVSKNIQEQLLALGVPKDKIEVIFNGVDVEEFAPGDVSRARLGLPENVTLALFVGDIRTNRKNLDTVLQALVEVRELHLAVVGSTEGSPYIELARELGLAQRVHFLGYRLDVAQIMRGVDLFVFPSRYEPFGMVVSEAMATGLPVITSAATGAAEIMTPDCGMVLPNTEDVASLAKALRTITDDPQLRQKMGQTGQKIARQHSWASKAGNYLDLFEELVPQ